MKKFKLSLLVLLLLILAVFLSFDQSKFNISNASFINMNFKLNENENIEFNYIEYQVMLRLLFQDKDIYPSEVKNEYLKIIEDNKEFLDNEYNQFLQFFTTFLKNNKKYKYTEEKLNDKQYIKARLYTIISNFYSGDLPIYYLQILDKPEDKNELKTYDILINSGKSLFGDIQNYLFNILKRMKQRKDFQSFFDFFTNAVNLKLNDLNLPDKAQYFLDALNLTLTKDFNFYILLRNHIVRYRHEKASMEQIFGYVDISDEVKLNNIVALAKIEGSLFKSSSIKFYPIIVMTYNFFEDDDCFILTYFHEMTHLFQSQYSAGYYPGYLFPDDLSNNSKILKYFSIFDKELALQEFDAELTSLYVYTSMNKNIYFEKIDDPVFIDMLLFYKHLLFEYLEYCSKNDIDKPFNIQNSKDINTYKYLNAFLKEYYRARFEESRKISKFLSNIEIYQY